jgi:hypothetical protein
MRRVGENGSAFRHESRTPERRRSGRGPEDRGAVLHQRFIGLARAIPFQHREFRMVQRAPLAVAEHAREIKNAPLTRREQLLAGELRRGVEEERAALPAHSDHLRGKGVQMRLVAGRNLQNAGLDLGEALPSNRSRNPALTALRVASSGGGRRECGAAHQGEGSDIASRTGETRRDRLGAPRSFSQRRRKAEPAP